MKGNQSFIMMRLLLAFAVVTVATSCLDNFDEYNHNPNETTDEELERDNYNVGAKLTLLQNEVIPTEEHLYQFTEILAGDAYGGYAESTSDSWETKFSTFNPSADWLKAPFVDVLTDTYPAYRGIRRVTEDEVPLALADILRVAIMHRLTDQYGPIPYSEMADPNSEALTAIYDTQQEVYTKMFEELDAAIAVLNANTSLSTEAFGDYDQVYAGNISKWILFANSLKLRMAMRPCICGRDDGPHESCGGHCGRCHRDECRQCEIPAYAQPHGDDMERLAGPRDFRRPDKLHERL